MFYNALSRKGKLAHSTPDDDEQDMMESVVSLHNAMNEKSWQKVLQWEQVFQAEEGKAARLLKFEGRPSDLSPKAWFKHHVLGHPLPFDRHDWTVIRPDGTTVRYVLDYYYDDSPSEEDTASNALLVDVRPALDSVSALWSRCAKMPLARHVFQSTSFEPLSMRPTFEMKNQVQESLQVWQNIQADVAASRGKGKQQERSGTDISESKARELAEMFAKTMKDCQKNRRALDLCDTEEDCARASMDFTLCMAKTVCPLQHKTLVSALQNDDDHAIEPALERVSECVALQSQLRSLAEKQHPNLFPST